MRQIDSIYTEEIQMITYEYKYENSITNDFAKENLCNHFWTMKTCVRVSAYSKSEFIGAF